MTAEPPPSPSAAPQQAGGHSSKSSLISLVASYDHTVVFRESMPSPFALAKLFTEMEENHGGLVLVGVESDGTVCGVSPEDLEATWSRFERLCAHLTDTRVELGTFRFDGRTIVFLIFNTLPCHLEPFSHFRRRIERTCIV